MLENLWAKHKDEFEIMNKAGDLMTKLTGINCLQTEIQKANIMSIKNWTTISQEIDRNT